MTDGEADRSRGRTQTPWRDTSWSARRGRQRASGGATRPGALLETKTTELVSPASTAALSEHRQYASALEGHIRTLMAEGNERGVVNGLSAINHEV